MNQRQYFFLFIITMALALLAAQPLAAQGNIETANAKWESKFRDHLTFTIDAKSSAQIKQAELFYQIVGELASVRNAAEFTPGTAITAKFTVDQTKPENYVPPGTEVEYWWKFVDANGNQLKTNKEKITLTDERYTWQQLQNNRLTLYWYQGDQKFGEALFQRANEALDTLSSDIGIKIEHPIKIFIYASHTDLMDAINATSPEWTGGQAFSKNGVVVIGIEPTADSLKWGLGAMSHEMTHLVVYQATDSPYAQLPRWLDEGIAVYNEDRNGLVQDFRLVFDQAVANNQLMTLRTLSSPFPPDPKEANLAYGQSGSVVKFIVDTYGPDAMAKLLAIFSQGALYDEALQQALGVDTDGLDNAFRASLHLPPLPGSKTETAPAANSAGAKATVEPAAQPQSGLGEVSGAGKAAQPETTPSPADKLAKLLPCLAGVLALVFMGGLVYGRR